MIEELVNKLYNKISLELLSFKSDMKDCEKDYVINNAYEIAIKEEIRDMFFGTEKYNKYELQALLEKENTLNFLYDNWMDSDGGIHSVIEENLEIGITDLTTDYVNDIKEKIDNDPNKELIENITEALKDFDSYDFCYHLKNKYGIEEIESIDIYQVLNSKDGKTYLYDLFSDLKDNEHLHYLNEISVINSENYDNITKEILPKLKELIKEDNKDLFKSNKSKDREER